MVSHGRCGRWLAVKLNNAHGREPKVNSGVFCKPKSAKVSPKLVQIGGGSGCCGSNEVEEEQEEEEEEEEGVDEEVDEEVGKAEEEEEEVVKVGAEVVDVDVDIEEVVTE